VRQVNRTRPPDTDLAHRVLLTLNALGEIATDLSRIGGRKNVVWITAGLPIALNARDSDQLQAVDYTPQVRKLSDGLDRAGIFIGAVRGRSLN
jgi:hypothetical protein